MGDPVALLIDLNQKFQENFKLTSQASPTMLVEVERKARVFTGLGEELRTIADSTTRKELCSILDEVFADLIVSIYLAFCSLDKPANMSLRRALEVSVAFVYLWDNASMYWSWKTHDKDLSFETMTSELKSPGYASFLQNEGSSFEEVHIKTLRDLYRELSNEVHGKLSSFETKLESKFSYDKDDINSHLIKMDSAQSALIKIFSGRFPSAKTLSL